MMNLPDPKREQSNYCHFFNHGQLEALRAANPPPPMESGPLSTPASEYMLRAWIWAARAESRIPLARRPRMDKYGTPEYTWDPIAIEARANGAKARKYTCYSNIPTYVIAAIETVTGLPALSIALTCQHPFRTTWSRWRAGKSKPPIDTLLKNVWALSHDRNPDKAGVPPFLVNALFKHYMLTVHTAYHLFGFRPEHWLSWLGEGSRKEELLGGGSLDTWIETGQMPAVLFDAVWMLLETCQMLPVSTATVHIPRERLCWTPEQMTDQLNVALADRMPEGTMPPAQALGMGSEMGAWGKLRREDALEYVRRMPAWRFPSNPEKFQKLPVGFWWGCEHGREVMRKCLFSMAWEPEPKIILDDRNRAINGLKYYKRGISTQADITEDLKRFVTNHGEDWRTVRLTSADAEALRMGMGMQRKTFARELGVTVMTLYTWKKKGDVRLSYKSSLRVLQMAKEYYQAFTIDLGKPK